MDICITSFENKLSTVLLLNESMTRGGIIHTINKQRRLKHLDPVIHNSTIDIAASIQAKQMARVKQLGHNLKGVKYPNLGDRMRVSEHAYSRAGEVLYSGSDDSNAAVQAWMNSPKHRAAILHPDVKEIGASVQYSDDGTPYACAVVCIPPQEHQKKRDSDEVVADVADRVWQLAKKHGKSIGKKALSKIAKSDRMKDIINSPIIQKIIAALK
jgi:hypothetical protein